MSKLTIFRGLPGSGKSTQAKELGCLHLEADMYFYRNGEYSFDPSLIGAAHRWCQNRTHYALAEGMDVAVANTFTKLWELKPYLFMSWDDIEVVNCVGDFGSVHNVPREAIEKMAKRWEEFTTEMAKEYKQ
jgi:hypothetical protein